MVCVWVILIKFEIKDEKGIVSDKTRLKASQV